MYKKWNTLPVIKEALRCFSLPVVSYADEAVEPSAFEMVYREKHGRALLKRRTHMVTNTASVLVLHSFKEREAMRVWGFPLRCGRSEHLLVGIWDAASFPLLYWFPLYERQCFRSVFRLVLSRLVRLWMSVLQVRCVYRLHELHSRAWFNAAFGILGRNWKPLIVLSYSSFKVCPVLFLCLLYEHTNT